MKHTECIEDLVIFDDTHLRMPHLNKESYRRLIHTVWCSKSVCDPSKKSYDELRKETQKRKDKRMHLPLEAIIEEIAKRVSGTFTYMLSYVMDVKIPYWSMNGFKFDENKCIYIPNIIPAIVDSENTHAEGSLKEDQCLNEIKNTKLEVGSKGGLNSSAEEVLETFFQQRNYVSKEDIVALQKQTGLKNTQIRGWLKRKRSFQKKFSEDKENSVLRNGGQISKRTKTVQ